MKLKKLIVAVAPSAARTTGCRTPSARRRRRGPCPGPRAEAPRRQALQEAGPRRRRTTRRRPGSTGADRAWTSRPPMLGPATYENARLPCITTRPRQPPAWHECDEDRDVGDLEEDAQRPHQERHDEHVRERKRVERVGDRDRADRKGAADIGRDHDRASSVTLVGPGARVEREEQVRRELGGDEISHLGGVRVERQDGDERHRDQTDLVAEQRDRLAEPEPPELRVLAQEGRHHHRGAHSNVARDAGHPCPDRRHRHLGTHVRAGPGRRCALSPLRLPGRPLRDRIARARRSGGRADALTGSRGWIAGVSLGLLLATGYGLQTAGLERTTVSSAGFITGLYVVFTPLLALLLFGTRVGGAVWLGVALAVAGLAMLSGVECG